jgi:hypothetical protein
MRPQVKLGSNESRAKQMKIKLPLTNETKFESKLAARLRWQSLDYHRSERATPDKRCSLPLASVVPPRKREPTPQTKLGLQLSEESKAYYGNL